jgi:hypothetical protein
VVLGASLGFGKLGRQTGPWELTVEAGWQADPQERLAHRLGVQAQDQVRAGG